MPDPQDPDDEREDRNHRDDDPTAGGGLTAAPSTASELYDTLDDIEKYLGYLKGNEPPNDYLMTMSGDLESQYESSEGHAFNIALDWEYKFPCPGGAVQGAPRCALDPGRQAGRHLRSPR